jgi:DNA primase
MDNIADEIKAKCNIVDIIGRVVDLKKKGINHVGLCPFHREKTPSFIVSEERQTFTCYGCGAKGDVISFVQQSENMTFMEAAERLAQEYGIKWSGVKSSGGKKDVHYEANKAAARFFYNAMRKNNKALHYLAHRGITADTIKKFGIGYADEGWDSLYNYLSEKNIDKGIMAELGLISQSKGKYFDKFRDRLMFPIINTSGKVIAFGGRILDKGETKYLNSQDSGKKKKKNNLYALNITRHDIVKEDQIILVEGYMDVISLYQHGVKNVTASLGTALTPEQAVIIKRYTGNAVIAYDSDNAGIAATQRGIDILKDAGCSVKVLKIDGAKDPDEYIRARGREEFLELVKDAPTYISYRLDFLKAHFNLKETEGRLKFLKEAARVLRTLSPVEAEMYIKSTAEETGIPEGALRTEIKNIPEQKKRSPGAAKISDTSDPRSNSDPQLSPIGGSMLERNLIRLVLQSRDYYFKIKQFENVFSASAIKRLFRGLAAVYEEDEELDQKKLEDSLEAEDREVLDSIRENVIISEQEEVIYKECVNTIILKTLTEQESDLIELLKTVDDSQEKSSADYDQGENNNKKVIELTEELLRIQREIREVKGR